MTTSKTKRVAVIGAGLMGHGIALEFALAGHDVRLHSRNEASLGKGIAGIRDSLERLAALGVVDRDRVEGIPEAIATTTSLSQAVDGAVVVVESVYEDLALKQDLFRELDDLCPEPTVLASNTSSFMPSDLAARTTHPERVVVGHYINPPFLVPLVEVVPSAQTSSETVETLCDILKGIGKAPIVLKREAPGFVASRLQAALLREALWLVDNGVATPGDVDTVIKTSLGRRWAVAGVFEVLELAGWDLIRAVANGLLPHLASSISAPTLDGMVEDGNLGAKSGQGFYEWTPESAEALRRRIAEALVQIDSWSK